MSIESNKLMNLADGKVLYDDMRGRHEELKENIAPEYTDLIFPVSQGAHCFYNGKYYKAKQDIQSSEDWNPEHWDVDTIESELLSQINAVSNMQSAIGDLIEVSSTEPQTEDNELWINSGIVNEYSVPTYNEFEALQSAINDKQDTSNLVTSLSSASTDTQYPSAKCVYDIIGDVETLLAAI